MSTLWRSPKKWVVLLVVAGLGMLLVVPIRNLVGVIAVQNAVEQDWEVEFDDSADPLNQSPNFLPPSTNAAVKNFLFETLRDPPDRKGDTLSNKMHRHQTYYERFDVLFRSPIKKIDIDGFGTFRGDLGAALARFPNLRCVWIDGGSPTIPSESEWTHLCAELRGLENLEEIKIGGALITDASIAPLAGHPNLRSLTLGFSRVTDGCTKTFVAIPHLEFLSLVVLSPDVPAWLTSERKAAMEAALPTVKIFFPEDPEPETPETAPTP